MSWGVGCRHDLDPELFRLWRRPVATAPIRPLAWEPPYAMGRALEKKKRQKKKKKKKRAGGPGRCQQGHLVSDEDLESPLDGGLWQLGVGGSGGGL